MERFVILAMLIRGHCSLPVAFIPSLPSSAYKEHRIGKILPRSSCCFSQCRIYSVLFHLGLDCDLFKAENFPALVKALRAPILSCSDQPSPTHFLPSDSGAVFQLRPGPCLSYIIRIALSPGLSLALSLE